MFPRLEQSAGLYRLTLTGGVACPRPRVYIGETNVWPGCRMASRVRSAGCADEPDELSRRRGYLRRPGKLVDHLAGG